MMSLTTRIIFDARSGEPEMTWLPEIGRDTKPWRVGQNEAAADKGREGFGKHSLERVLHGVMLK
jgi:hypothetical protein